MNEIFDSTTLIIIGLAVVVFFKLRSVLGQRTGHQKPFDPFQPPADQDKTGAESPDKPRPGADDNVIAMPDRGLPERESETPPSQVSDDEDEVLSGAARKFSSELAQILQYDSEFSLEQFLAGAKSAYEMVVTGFADGNKKSLKNLLSKDVYRGFAGAIDERKKRKLEMTTQFIGIDEADVKKIEIEGTNALITVRFVSELVSWVKDSSGKVIEGSETDLQKITDIWTFERNLRSKDPNWLLVATDEDDS